MNPSDLRPCSTSNPSTRSTLDLDAVSRSTSDRNSRETLEPVSTPVSTLSGVGVEPSDRLSPPTSVRRPVLDVDPGRPSGWVATRPTRPLRCSIEPTSTPVRPTPTGIPTVDLSDVLARRSRRSALDVRPSVDPDVRPTPPTALDPREPPLSTAALDSLDRPVRPTLDVDPGRPLDPVRSERGERSESGLPSSTLRTPRSNPRPQSDRESRLSVDALDVDVRPSDSDVDPLDPRT